MQTVNSPESGGRNLSNTQLKYSYIELNNHNLDPSKTGHNLTNLELENDSHRSVTEVISQLNQHSLDSRKIKPLPQILSKLQLELKRDDTGKLDDLIDEYGNKLGNLSCGDELCKTSRLSNYKLLQILLNKIHNQKTNQTVNEQIQNKESKSESMEQKDLLDLVTEKEKRIQDLERLLEVQKRLRMQDANQVEEKAARIKEWVSNKLKELENQNRQLRDQNKKQKETVESLSNRLASLNHLCTPKRTLKTNMTQVIDRFASSSQTDCQRSNLENESTILRAHEKFDSSSSTNIKKMNQDQESNCRTESPIYDSVSFDKANRVVGEIQSENKEKLSGELVPPPPPLHQRDKWELELYTMADEIFSSLIKKPEDDFHPEDNQVVTRDSYSYRHESRKSTSSIRNDLISLVKPSFTTIDGNNVVDDDSIEPVPYSDDELDRISSESTPRDNKSRSILNEREAEVDLPKHEIDNLPLLMTFDSPLRAKSGKDCLLKTQSVRKSIESEKLFSFISSDLVKRGWLVKPGTLKNYSRWIVLKNFQLHIYKNDTDELSKLKPITVIRLTSDTSVQPINHSGESNFPFKIFYNDKYLQLSADSSFIRDEWIKIISVTINMSNIDARMLTKQNASCEGLLSITRHGHTKRCYAILIDHVVFFLRSMTDPTPLSYLSLKDAKIREKTNNFDHNLDNADGVDRSYLQDCSLAIYPKHSLNLDPMYMTMGNQQDTDKWLYYLSIASGVQQLFGTPFEQTLTRFMLNKWVSKDASACNIAGYALDSSLIEYTDQPITQPLTTLPNETFRAEALELFKSILLITRVPVEPVAVDYHVSLIQNCFCRFLKHPELRNEFFAQLIKQSNYYPNHSTSPKLSSSSSGCSVDTNHQQKTYFSTTSQSNLNQDNFESSSNDWRDSAQQSPVCQREKDSNYNDISIPLPPHNELLQVMQVLAIAVSLNLPKGRIRWWLNNLLNKISNPSTDIGKYALYTLRAIERTTLNGSRESVPSRTEIISIILRNPYDHSHPHSLPVNFCDASYVIVEADGSTTVEEFINGLSKNVNIRNSSNSDFYLFADDPSGLKDLHILEPYRKILDIVSWWEQTFRKNNHGKYENTKVIKLIFRKRLVLRAEDGETQQERLLIVHQFHQEVISHKIHLNDNLIADLAALLAQVTYGNIMKLENSSSVEKTLQKVVEDYLPKYSSQSTSHGCESKNSRFAHLNDIASRWSKLSDKSPEDCVRVYLNCIRRLNLCMDIRKQMPL